MGVTVTPTTGDVDLVVGDGATPPSMDSDSLLKASTFGSSTEELKWTPTGDRFYVSVYGVTAATFEFTATSTGMDTHGHP